MEDGGAESIEECRHAGAGGVVISGDLQKIRIVLGARVVFFRAVERAERHVLHDVKTERFLRRDGLSRAV